MCGHELKLSKRSKAELGHRLAHGKGDANAKPEKARPARISMQDTRIEAFTTILASAIRQIAVNRQADWCRRPKASTSFSYSPQPSGLSNTDGELISKRQTI
jgi:inorganic triphosphatase YgiF